MQNQYQGKKTKAEEDIFLLKLSTLHYLIGIKTKYKIYRLYKKDEQAYEG